MQIKCISSNYVKNLAQLHTQIISTGFISSLGVNFVTALYETIADNENSFGFVAAENDKFLGFVAFTENLSRLFKSAIRNNGFKFMLAVGLKLFRPSICKRIIQNILYPSRTNKMSLPKAELISIVVDPEFQGKGIAKKLCQAGLDECRKRGIDNVKVLVAANNEPANNLYVKCGFKLAVKVNSHGVPSNIYVADLTKESFSN
ncbi:MAG: GNAT family N-acetyltransferase [Planctomycetota bacterium]|jgi:ribosomal protein S18 acetylase RimI-like enzyme